MLVVMVVVVVVRDYMDTGGKGSGHTWLQCIKYLHIIHSEVLGSSELPHMSDTSMLPSPPWHRTAFPPSQVPGQDLVTNWHLTILCL